LCLSQARTLISICICCGVLCVQWFEVWDQVVDNGGIVDHLFSNFLFIEWSKRISRNSNDYLKASCLNYAYWSFRKFKFLNSNLQTASISISWNTELNLQGFLTQVEDSHWNIAKSGIKHHKTNQNHPNLQLWLNVRAYFFSEIWQ
jgi:hypothetical protein